MRSERRMAVNRMERTGRQQDGTNERARTSAPATNATRLTPALRIAQGSGFVAAGSGLPKFVVDEFENLRSPVVWSPPVAWPPPASPPPPPPSALFAVI